MSGLIRPGQWGVVRFLLDAEISRWIHVDVHNRFSGINGRTDGQV